MRIAHLVLSLDVGGQERLILHLSRALMARGHELHVVSLTPHGAMRRDFTGISLHDVPRKDRFDPMLVPLLARAFRKIKPDVVHTHNSTPLIYGAPAAKLGGVPRIVHTKHGNNEYSDSALWLARGATQVVTSFVAVSTETAEIARAKERPRASTLRVIPNGIPLDQFALQQDARAAARTRIRDELKIPRDAVVVGSVGRLVSEKDYPFLVRAMAPLLSTQVRLVLVGEGAARSEIESEIRTKVSPDKQMYISLAGPRRDVPDLLAAFDLFVLSSRTEGLPLAIPEAMAASLPIVATRVGGLPGIVPSEVGLLVDHGDEAALTAAIATFVQTDERRAKTSAEAKNYAFSRFSLEPMTTAYEALYAGEG